MFQVAGGIIIAVGMLGFLATIGDGVDGTIRRARLQADAERNARAYRKRVVDLLAMPEAELKALARPRSVEQAVYLYRYFSKYPHPTLSAAELQPGIHAIANR